MMNLTLSTDEMELLADGVFREAGRLALDGAQRRANAMVDLYVKITAANLEVEDGART